MVRPHGAPQAKKGRQRCQENRTSLSAEVLCLRLQTLNLPITMSKAELVNHLKATGQQPRADNPPPAGRVHKHPARKHAVRPIRTHPFAQVDELADNDTRKNVNDDASSIASEDNLDESLDVTPVDLNLSELQSQPALFMAMQLATIQDTAWLSLDQALQSSPFLIHPSVGLAYYRLTSPPSKSHVQQRPGGDPLTTKTHSAFSIRWTRTWSIKSSR